MEAKFHLVHPSDDVKRILESKLGLTLVTNSTDQSQSIWGAERPLTPQESITSSPRREIDQSNVVEVLKQTTNAVLIELYKSLWKGTQASFARTCDLDKDKLSSYLNGKRGYSLARLAIQGYLFSLIDPKYSEAKLISGDESVRIKNYIMSFKCSIGSIILDPTTIFHEQSPMTFDEIIGRCTLPECQLIILLDRDAMNFGLDMISDVVHSHLVPQDSQFHNSQSSIVVISVSMKYNTYPDEEKYKSDGWLIVLKSLTSAKTANEITLVAMASDLDLHLTQKNTSLIIMTPKEYGEELAGQINFRGKRRAYHYDISHVHGKSLVDTREKWSLMLSAMIAGLLNHPYKGNILDESSGMTQTGGSFSEERAMCRINTNKNEVEFYRILNVILDEFNMFGSKFDLKDPFASVYSYSDVICALDEDLLCQLLCNASNITYHTITGKYRCTCKKYGGLLDAMYQYNSLIKPVNKTHEEH